MSCDSCSAVLDTTVPCGRGQRLGVFAGSGMHAYLIYHLATNPALMASVGDALHGILMFPVLKRHNERIAFGQRMEVTISGTSEVLATQCGVARR